MKRFYVAKCWDGSSIEDAKKPWSWDVVDRLGSTESTLFTVSSHQSRVLARHEADELNNCTLCVNFGAFRGSNEIDGPKFHSHDSSASATKGEAAGVQSTE
jgi:hypothetical protein